MRLGIQINGKSADDVVRRLAKAREAGFFLCQINLLQGGVTRADLLKIADAIEEHGVRPVAIGCYLNPMRPDEPSPIGSTRADLDVILHTLDMIGARNVVIASGTHAEALHESHPDNASPESLDALGAFLTDVVRATSARSYALVIEPWSTHVLSSAQRVAALHSRLDASVAPHVRFVLDPIALMTPDDYADRDAFVEQTCRTIGPMSGLARLQDCRLLDAGTVGIAHPGGGDLDYPAYAASIMAACPANVPAVACNVRSEAFAATRDFLLRASSAWRLV